MIMATTNDKPVHTPNTQSGNTPKQPIAGGTADRKPTSDENEENKVKEPNNPKAVTTPSTEPAKAEQKAL